MNCADFKQLSPLYLSGELDAARVGQVEGHVQACPTCARELELDRALDIRLREAVLSEEVDTSAVEHGVRAAIATRHTQLWKRAIGWPLAAGVAATLLLIFTGYRFLTQPPLSRVYADAAQDHSRVAKHKEWLTDMESVAQLSARYGIPEAVVRTLAPAGYRLAYAKTCKLAGDPTVHFVYTNGVQEVSIYLRPRSVEPLPGAVRSTVNGRELHALDVGSEHLATFKTDHWTALVVSDQSEETAISLASSMARTIS